MTNSSEVHSAPYMDNITATDTSQQSNSRLILHLYTRIDFQRIGYVTVLTLAFFNAQFGNLIFNRPHDVEMQNRLPAPTVQTGERESNRASPKRMKKHKPRKRKAKGSCCF